MQKKTTKKHASSSCARVAFILLGISWEQLGIWCRPLKSKTPLSVSMEQQTRQSLGRITMQCYMHTLRCMVPVHHTLDMECMLMIASIVQLPCHKRMHRTMTEFDKARTSPATHLWLMYMDMVMILKRHINAERVGLLKGHMAEVSWITHALFDLS